MANIPEDRLVRRTINFSVQDFSGTHRNRLMYKSMHQLIDWCHENRVLPHKFEYQENKIFNTRQITVVCELPSPTVKITGDPRQNTPEEHAPFRQEYPEEWGIIRPPIDMDAQLDRALRHQREMNRLLEQKKKPAKKDLNKVKEIMAYEPSK